MISIKNGAKLDGLRAEILLGFFIIAKVFSDHEYDITMTEATGGDHMKTSLHYKGLALDIRSKNIVSKAMKHQMLEECAMALGDNYDFIIEDEGQPNEHFHVEFDPQ